MSKVYVGQTELTVNIDLAGDITGVSSVTAAVRGPDGTLGASWTMTVDTASTGAISYSAFTSGSFDTSGTYLIQPLVSFTTTSLKGETVKLQVFKAFE